MKRFKLAKLAVLCFSISLVFASVLPAICKIPDGYRDIQLGMKKSEVVQALEKGSTHSSFEDLGEQVGEIIRGDELFRYASYRFDEEGVLVEIALSMREVLGRDAVLQIYNSKYGLNLAPLKTLVESDCSIEVRGDSVVIKQLSSKETRSAKSSHK
jgi:hypothetical protein